MLNVVMLSVMAPFLNEKKLREFASAFHWEVHSSALIHLKINKLNKKLNWFKKVTFTFMLNNEHVKHFGIIVGH